MAGKPISLEKAQELIKSGWSLHFDRHVDGLRVWIDHPSEKGVFKDCFDKDFAALAVSDRERQRSLRREQTLHVTVLNSSAVYSYGYDVTTGVFEVRWTRASKPRTKGVLWRWTGVPQEVVTDFELCKSKGAFLTCPDRFRGRYEGGSVPEGEAPTMRDWRKSIDMIRGKQATSMSGGVA